MCPNISNSFTTFPREAPADIFERAKAGLPQRLWFTLDTKQENPAPEILRHSLLDHIGPVISIVKIKQQDKMPLRVFAHSLYML